MINNKTKTLLQFGTVALLLILITTPAVFRVLNWERYLHNNYLSYFLEFDPTLPSRSVTWRLERRLVQYTIIRELHGRTAGLAPTTAIEEIEALKNSLLAFRSYVRTQSEIPHRMLDCPAIVSGLGWCNQINEDAAIWLAQEFGVCYVVAIYDPETKKGHTIGRAKSRFDGQWIYFDAWPPKPCLFKVTQQGTADYLPAKTAAAAASALPERDMDFQRLDALAAHSPITGTFSRNYVGYLASRLTRHEDTRVVEAGTIESKELVMSADQLRIYVEARVAHLQGSQSKAISLYEASANYSKTGSLSVLGAAAESYARAARHEVRSGS